MASRSEVRKVFALGLDGATLRRIRPWVSQGELPHFERLMREGVFVQRPLLSRRRPGPPRSQGRIRENTTSSISSNPIQKAMIAGS